MLTQSIMVTSLSLRKRNYRVLSHTVIEIKCADIIAGIYVDRCYPFLSDREYQIVHLTGNFTRHNNRTLNFNFDIIQIKNNKRSLM